jgi:hypothetical protein
MRQVLRGLSAFAIAFIPAIFSSGAALVQEPLINIKYDSPELISPPDRTKSVDWIRSGFVRP